MIRVESVYPQAVLGWRVWSVSEKGLHSWGMGNTLWRPGVNVAYCVKQLQLAPGENCHCGFNLFNTLGAASAAKDNASSAASLIVGCAIGRGSAHIHHTGVRVEEAQIAARLVDPGLSDRAIKHLRETYQVPLFHHTEQIEEYASKLAPTVPENLIPSEVEPVDLPPANPLNDYHSKESRKARTIDRCIGAAMLILGMGFAAWGVASQLTGLALLGAVLVFVCSAPTSLEITRRVMMRSENES